MSEPEVLFEVSGHAGVITLNRPHALNALTFAMVEDMSATLSRWAGDDAVRHVVISASGDKAFCAGGDIRELYEWGRANEHEKVFRFFRAEYLLNTLIKRFPKPYVALIDGLVMGGGVGVSVHGSHRVASQRLTFAMPETGIGFFPDVGGTYFLPRLPGEAGMYFGLTGERCRTADALYAGIATHHVPGERFSELAEALSQADEVDECLQRFAADPGAPPRSASARPTSTAISATTASRRSLPASSLMHRSGRKRPPPSLRSKSPTSLKVTFRQLREGRNLDFEACMRLEYRIVHHMFANPDLYEGIRAVVIDKDRSRAGARRRSKR
jgi:enoyl-CoA hydratase